MPRVTSDLMNVLVDLHSVDVDAIGLGGFGRPDGFLARQVALWRRQWNQVGTRDLPDLERLHKRLAEAVPRGSEATLIHGDYRIDNAILDRGEPATVRAIVDWELSTVGDPLTDLALMCVYRSPALDIILGMPAAWTSPRVPSPEALTADSARLSGRKLENWPFHLGLAHLKLAVIAEGIAHRARSGADAGREAGRSAEVVPELIAAGLEALGRQRTVV